MATAKKAGSVEHKVLPSGDHAIGLELDGVFVPFAQLDGNYVQGLIESGKSPEAKAAAGDSEGGGE